MRRIALLVMAMLGTGAWGQGTSPAKADAPVEAAQALVGRALFLRGLPASDDLRYDAAGRMQGAAERVDWTLAGIDVKQVSRRGNSIEIEGIRVAIRFNQENRQFERHPRNSETVNVRVADAENERGFEATLDAIFAQGIDPRLQRETPPFWRHYFDPGLAWPPDGLTVPPIDAASPAAKDVIPPVAAHKVDAHLNAYAERDTVRGTVQMRLVIDTEGVPRRIAIARPLGYGLDESAVESVARWRFTPAMRDGKPVAVTMTVNYDFQ